MSGMITLPGGLARGERRPPSGTADRRLPAVLLLLVLALGAVTGCATTGPVSASGRPIAPETFLAADQRLVDEQIPVELQPYYRALYAEGRENEALHAMRAGLAALHAGRKDLATSALERAVRDVEALDLGGADAQRAQRKFTREEIKWFKGESYERAALYLYRGFLYLIENDFGNAAACFKRVQLQDITGDDAPDFAGDWATAEWALAYASLKQGFGSDAENAMQRAAAFPGRHGDLVPPEPDHNVVVFVEVGHGPKKYRDGRYGEQLRFREFPPPIRQVEVRHRGRVLAVGEASEDLYHQATTRGTRAVDYILQGKAAFKEGTETAAVILGAGAVIASDHNDTATGILGGLALVSAVASAATTPQADIRQWDNLPHSIHLLSLSLPPGRQVMEVIGLAGTGRRVDGLTVEMNIEANDPVSVAFVRL